MISPHDISSEDKLIGTFGKWEMEHAARRIISLCKDANSWEIGFTMDDFKSADPLISSEMAEDGFICLIYHKWLSKKTHWFFSWIANPKPNLYYLNKCFMQRLEDHLNKKENKGINP